MARITSTALAILLCLVQSPLASAATPLTIVDSTGSLTRVPIPPTTLGNGLVAILTSPGTPSYFADAASDSVTLTSSDGVSFISSPGATLSGSSSLSKGRGAAAAAAVSGCIIVSGITESDLEFGLDDTRHGTTLTGIFKAGIEANGEMTTLIITVPADIDQSGVVADVKAVFETAKTELGSSAELDDLYSVSVQNVASEADAQKVMQMASEAASQTDMKSNISKTIIDVYSQSSASGADASPTATAAILACDDSFARHYRAARAKLFSWKSRAGRDLVVDNFGVNAAQMMKRTMELFDRDTISAAGCTGSVASYRMEVRSKLQGRIEATIRELFQLQVEVLEKSTLKKFNAMLLRKHAKNNEGKEKFYNDNDAALRSATFAFENAVTDLEVPSLSLTKTKVAQEMSNKLNTALLTFSDSPAARLKDMKQIERAVNKQKQPTERSLDFGLDLVAMIRPDGFGNLQGFGGYQLGGNSIIVGVHNDADSPDVIAQFGGKRPPFLRVQPKLKVDIEI